MIHTLARMNKLNTYLDFDGLQATMNELTEYSSLKTKPVWHII